MRVPKVGRHGRSGARISDEDEWLWKLRSQANGIGELSAPFANGTVQCIVMSRKAPLRPQYCPRSLVQGVYVVCVRIVRSRSMFPPNDFTTFRFRNACMTEARCHTLHLILPSGHF